MMWRLALALALLGGQRVAGSPYKNTRMAQAAHAAKGGGALPMHWWHDAPGGLVPSVDDSDFDTTTRLKDFYLVQFYRPDSAACAAAAPHLERLARKLAAARHDVGLVRVNSGEDQSRGPHASDRAPTISSGGVVAGWYGVTEFPTLMLMARGQGIWSERTNLEPVPGVAGPDAAAHLAEPVALLEWLE
jgi:thiol-disulfide isomerase/thioredoxin